jgi:hypothetical protein
MARVRVVPAGFAARAPKRRERERERRGKTTGVSKGVVELSGNVLKTCVI